MDSALGLHRLHFAFTITYHYLFPQLTMGLALLIFVLKTMALKTGNPLFENASRFWIRIFGINFAMGVVTGIPMEFQFGTNWSRFSKAAGGVIGQTLAMEGMYSFFLESTFLGILLYGREKVGPRVHWLASLGVFVGSWLSGFFIIATDAWMQHPVGHRIGPNGEIILESLQAFLLNPWTYVQYAHNMTGSVVTASAVMCAVGAFYVLSKRHEEYGRLFLQIGVPVFALSAVMVAFPTGDMQGKMVANHQPAALAAMEGHFDTKEGASLHVIGQPDVEKQRIDNPIALPKVLSFISYGRWNAEVKGLNEIPRENWPDNIPLLYYSFHIMVGLGTLFMALSLTAFVLLRMKRLFQTKAVLWALLLCFPLPYIANTAGWMTAELGRQPWLIYGLMRTADGYSRHVSSGNTLFTLLGFMGLYTLLSMLFLFLVQRELAKGPGEAH
ncbi:MAG TPA: cytochrome ubiquinol oxidase subunit I [Bryobacteraceae bacterium]|nr:cytochrome ubiquinol oxidase subunit I [Bryobacteraceae bacterium]